MAASSFTKPLGLDLAAKRLRKRSDYSYVEDYRSRWADNDMFHHLNNPIYGVLIDSIINNYLILQGGYSTANAKQIGIVANTYCDYFGSAHYPGMLEIGLRVVKLGRTSVMYECGIYQQGEEQVKAVGGFIQIWVERETNRPAADGIPKYIRDKLELLLKGSEQDPAFQSKL